MASLKREKKCKDNIGGVKELYIFKYVNIPRSQIKVENNILVTFPFSGIYDINANQISFTENVDEQDGGVVYTQNGGFQFPKIKVTDNYKAFLEKDWRIIIKDNNDNYRLLGLETGLKIKFNKETGTELADFNGFKFSFETKEENTAPFLNNLHGFLIIPSEGLTTSITLGGLILTQNSNALTFN